MTDAVKNTLVNRRGGIPASILYELVPPGVRMGGESAVLEYLARHDVSHIASVKNVPGAAGQPGNVLFEVRAVNRARGASDMVWHEELAARGTNLSANLVGWKAAASNVANGTLVGALAEKLHDVVGLYLNPPENAVVFSVDEKSSVQALDRTQPGLPIKKGRCGTMTHDYKRHGTTTLFAALDVATGAVIGESYRRHRHQEVLRFLKKVEKTVPKEQELHIILDNYATHKHEEVLRWIERGKRIFLHFIPTSSSWLNMVERFFRTLTDRQIRRGVFTSVKELEARLAEYIDTYNENPQPFVWTKSAKQILDKVGRARQALGHQST